MHPLFLLVFATFVLVIGFLVWNKISVDRNKAGQNTDGIGGPSDPLSGKTEGIRPPDQLRASLDAAANETPR